jgi:hypothetical protein
MGIEKSTNRHFIYQRNFLPSQLMDIHEQVKKFDVYQYVEPYLRSEGVERGWVVDLGCQLGLSLVRFIESEIDFAGYIGIEIDSEIDQFNCVNKFVDVRKCLKLFNAKRLRFENAFVETYDLGTQQNEVVIAKNILHFIEPKTRQDIIKRIYESMVDGGIFHYEIYHEHSEIIANAAKAEYKGNGVWYGQIFGKDAYYYLSPISEIRNELKDFTILKEETNKDGGLRFIARPK